MAGRREPQLVRLQSSVFALPRWALLIGLIIRCVFRAVRFVFRYWRVTGPAFLLAWLGFNAGWKTVPILLVLVAAGLSGWRVGHRESFDRWVRWPFASRWRRWWLYRRGWEPTMRACGLSVSHGSELYWPRVLSVTSSVAGDVVRLRMLRGQTPEHYTGKSAELAYSFGTRLCRVFSGRVNVSPRVHSGRLGSVMTWCERRKYGRDRPTEMTLVFVRGDLLAYVMPAIAADRIASAPDLARLPVGLREDNAPLHLGLAQTHILIAGATGAGKGSVIWSILRAMAGGIRSGLVQVWAIDPKGGMELAMGQRMFARFAYSSLTEMADVLDQAVDVMRERQNRLAGAVRQHTPTPQDPTIVVLVDELAALTAYLTDKDLRARIESALAMLLSQGRALGVHVIAAVQDPRKEVVKFRDLFPTRVGLRMTEDEQVDMVLGAGARKRGALADQIPASLPGVGYMVLDQRPEPVRVRFTHVTDEHIRDMNARFACPNPYRSGPVDQEASTSRPTVPAQTSAGRRTGVMPAGLLDKLRAEQ
ncbi:FtsK/SpoIIIE domain-containing protein [Actinocatenispora sera]|uniref:FtsK/SpoIIIE domain-containing protein n=1 Tax=Actinocatenispora sera TaxID=390989 RepID=UPI0033D8BBC0